jgi:ATP-binding cassette, subfamily C (CFTR/MRP), member 1
MIRSGLISMIYQQTTLLKANDLKDKAGVTLMDTDVEQIVTNLQAMHEAWAALLDVRVAIWLLERQLGVACLVSVIA